jgi:hypothetical protein
VIAPVFVDERLIWKVSKSTAIRNRPAGNQAAMALPFDARCVQLQGSSMQILAPARWDS